MIGFVEYLISKGYKPYRKVMSKKGSTYVEDSNIGFYSSMSAGVEYLIIYEDICLRSIILSVRGVVGEKLILLPN